MRSRLIFVGIAVVLGCKSGGELAPKSNSADLQWSFSQALTTMFFANGANSTNLFSSNAGSQFTYSNAAATFSFSGNRPNCAPIESSVLVNGFQVQFQPATCGNSTLRYLDLNGNVIRTESLYYIFATRSFGATTEFLNISFLSAGPVSGEFLVGSSAVFFIGYSIVERDVNGKVIRSDYFYGDSGKLLANNSSGFVVSSNSLRFNNFDRSETKFFKFSIGCCAQ